MDLLYSSKRLITGLPIFRRAQPPSSKMGTHFAEGRRPSAMSRDESEKKREHYKESVAAVARMMDYVDSCYSFLNDDVYLQQVAAQISDPIARYPTIRVKGLRSGKIEIHPPTSPRVKANGYRNNVEKISTAQAGGNAPQKLREPVSILRRTKPQAKCDRLRSPKTPQSSAAGDTNSMSIPSVDRGIRLAKRSSSAASFSSLVDGRRSTFLPTAAASDKQTTSHSVSSKKLPSPFEAFASPLSEITCKPVPVGRASAFEVPPGTSLLKSSASASTSLSDQAMLNVSLKPRPRRQASLRVNEFVRAEAELNGQHLDPHKMRRPPNRAVVKAEPSDVADAVGGDYTIFEENATDDGADDDNAADAGPSSEGVDEGGQDIKASDDRQRGSADYSSSDLASEELFRPVANEPTGYSCLYCDQVFIRAEAMETHIMDEHIYRSGSSAPPAEPATPSVPLVASSSLTRSGGPTWVQSPSGRHQTVKPPPGKTITIESLLSAHMNATSKRTKSGRRQLCLICKKTFTSWSQLKKHLPIHSSEKPHKCPYESCRYATVQKGNLKVHMLRVHILRQEKMEAARMEAARAREGV
ncbi:spalt transcription factor 2 [Tropilaelaps mercedesae]|uniref:Spalt transcription factor 2 n=1 Tax=Tropilaelaps mercedesae TaxID=418985 RepID=A0A1V9XZV5_9ACAR|nr:spalt transcription factor 2 [Tropilaelaps mercedesae]